MHSGGGRSIFFHLALVLLGLSGTEASPSWPQRTMSRPIGRLAFPPGSTGGDSRRIFNHAAGRRAVQYVCWPLANHGQECVKCKQKSQPVARRIRRGSHENGKGDIHAAIHPLVRPSGGVKSIESNGERLDWPQDDSAPISCLSGLIFNKTLLVSTELPLQNVSIYWHRYAGVSLSLSLPRQSPSSQQLSDGGRYIVGSESLAIVGDSSSLITTAKWPG